MDDPLRVIGACTVLFWLCKSGHVFSALYAFFFRKGMRLSRYGEWAVVTGATDGIGKAYAFELAKKGLSVLLLSRTPEKLQEVQKEIREKYPKVQVEVLPIDFGKFDAKA